MHIAFPGKRILVAGAARGIAEAFAERGAEVFASDLLAEEVARFAGPAAGGGAIHALAADVTDAASVAAMVTEAGAIDGLVYVAGGVRGQSPHPIEEVEPEDWRAIVDANLTGAFLCARAVAPLMKQAGQGRIVIISSRSGLATSLTGIQSYAAAKHGQLGLMKQLAAELGPHGVTVNAVAPGFMPTSPDYERQWAGYGEAGQKALVERVAMRRLGRPEDIAHAVLFLASDYASWITGQVLPVTGGPVA
ncbi:SDR family NAD(P)-dependent oxidoreductase [Inquilinus limosus]|uniref:Short-chain dehydrogenase n=1 Tax=Inquilinus limosus TaxID=171674 RepID=A0A211ZUF6_9PROT|nr:SDR family NAD(P)-dependent oxidoreductase [Inquilinus limosus]OWJ68920.1 short-chain dehydrogenase [Inquilinus limosus]